MDYKIFQNMEKKARVMLQIHVLKGLQDKHIFDGHNDKERNFNCESCNFDCNIIMQEFLHNPDIEKAEMDEESKNIVKNFNLPL